MYLPTSDQELRGVIKNYVMSYNQQRGIYAILCHAKRVMGVSVFIVMIIGNASAFAANRSAYRILVNNQYMNLGVYTEGGILLAYIQPIANRIGATISPTGDGSIRISLGNNAVIAAPGNPTIRIIISGQERREMIPGLGFEPARDSSGNFLLPVRPIFEALGLTVRRENNMLQIQHPSFTVTFNPNNGTVSPTTRSVRSSSAVGTLPTPTRAGHTFVGWFTAVTGGTQVNANTVVNGHVTYFARWTALPASFTVTFNPNNGTVNPTTRSVQSGSAVGTLPTPTRAGHTFVGWFTAATGGTQVNANTVVNGHVTYFARWTALPASFTVTFNPNNGTVSPTTRSVQSGSAVGALPTPTRAGHTFVGWFTAVTGGTQVNANTVVRGNITYFARWITSPLPPQNVRAISTRPNSVTLSWDSAGSGISYRVYWGAQNDPTRATAFSTLATGTSFNITTHRDYYFFWVRSLRNGQQSSMSRVASVRISNAPPTQPSFTVTFNPTGGTVSPTTRSVQSGSAVGSLPTPTRAGHRFDGWFTAATGALG